MSDLLEGLAQLDQHAPGYLTAQDYYDGTVPEAFASDALARRLRKTGERYRINMAKTPVNVVADRLEISAVTAQGSAQEVTTLLQSEVWDRNELLLETPDWNRKACTYGDGYIVVWEGEQDGTVDVWFNSPATMRLVYDPENPRRKLYAVKGWKAGELKRATLYYADRIERYVTKQGTSGEADEDWTEYVDNEGDAWPIPNPHGQVPVFHLRTASPYGVPVHRDAYGPQDALTKIIVTMMSATDYAGFPLRYALTEPNATVDGKAGTTAAWPEGDETNATANDREQADQLPVGPGKVWITEGLKGVGQLEPADPKHFLDPASFLIRVMAQVTTTPMHYFDPSGDVPSGESLRTADAPLVKRIRYLQMRFASAYSEALSFALKILGRTARVDVRWAPATSTDDGDSWTVAQQKIDAGVPVRQVLLEQGYTTEQVDKWLRENGEDNLAQRVKLLAELAKAVQQLGAGMALGAVSAEQVAAVVDAFLPAATTGEPADEREPVAA